MKCFNIHGHTYKAELTWKGVKKASIGYAVDFKEIKRVHLQWIDDKLDHGFIANPHDAAIIDLVRQQNNKLWVMTANGQGQYCNPTAENIALEMFCCLAYMTRISELDRFIAFDRIDLWETPNCKVSVCDSDVDQQTYEHVIHAQGFDLVEYVKQKGTLQYDDRLVQ